MKIIDLDEGYNSYHNNRTGFASHRRDPAEDESNLLYIFKDGRLQQAMISNRIEREARAQGFRDTPEQALKLHGIVKSKFHHGKWIKNEGGKWIEVHPFGKPEVENEDMASAGVTETATAGATMSANIGTVVSPHIAIGKKNIGKKSYIGSPGKSGTKAPKLPKIVQPKNKDGTAKNALDIKGTSLFGGPAVKRS